MQLTKTNSLILNVSFTNNNILCTLIDLKGKVKIFSSIGSYKTKGLKKITSTNINSLTKSLYFKFSKTKLLYVKFKGTNKYKNDFIKSLKVIGFTILLIQVKLCLPHGGCKIKKSRKL